MTEEQRQKDDPTIRRVRAARHEISAEHDHDPKRVVDYYVERQKNQATEEADSAEET